MISDRTLSSVTPHVQTLIVGSGFAGLGAAIKLTRSGRRDFLVIERAGEVGGTWRDNTYPGAACDVPSHLYSYSFELNPGWTRSFSSGWEIQEYLRTVARKYRVLDKHLFHCEMTAACWDGDAARWVLDTTRGRFTADVLVSAVGVLCEPAAPKTSGLDSFAGELFHSARWNHDARLAGKRVAVIGTGASAIQIVPEIARQVSHLDVYQRTAPWVMPRRDRTFPRAEALAYRHVPGAQRLARAAIYWGRESFVFGFTGHPRAAARPREIALEHIRRKVRDPALRAAVTPNFEIGCKRILLSNDWYPALQRDNVELVTDRIAEIAPHAVVTADGTVRPVDAIVAATGFHVTDSPAHELIRGADGRTLAETWRQHGQRAYKGFATAGFPNLFILTGPNTGLGHTSMIFMIESQLNYLIGALDAMQRHRLATLEVHAEAQDAYNERIQAVLAKSVWNTGGCVSWYLDAHGRNTTIWPTFTFTFRRITRRFDLAAYRCTARADVDQLFPAPDRLSDPEPVRSGEDVIGEPA